MEDNNKKNLQEDAPVNNLLDIIEISPFPTLIHKMGVIRYLNDLAVEMFEAENASQLIGRNMLEFTIMEDSEEVKEAIRAGEALKVRNTIVKARIKTFKGNVITTENKSVNVVFGGEECRLVVAYNYDHYSKVEAELNSKKLLLEKIAQMIPDSLLVVNNITREVLFENKPLMEVLGYTKDDLNGNDQFTLFTKIIHKDDMHKLVEARQFLYAPENEGKYIATEYRVKAKDGSWHWILSRSTLYKKNEDGSSQINFGIAQDITNIKEIEQQLLENKNFIEKITKTVPDHISIFEIGNRDIVYDNFFYGSLLGYERHEIPADMLIYFSEDYRPVAALNFEKIAALKDGERFTTITKNLHKNGSIKYLLTSVTPFSFHDDGRIKQYLSATLDVTDFKEAEFKLQLSEEERKAILMALPDMLFQVKKDGTITNVFASEIYREAISNLKLIGSNSSSILPPAFYEQVMNTIQQVLGDGQMRSIDYTHAERDRNMYYELRISKLNEGSVIVVVRDITNLITTRQQLDLKFDELSVKNRELEKYITSNTELEQFAYIASHDLREPIRSIIGFTQLLQKRCPEDQLESKEFLENIIHSAQRMNSLVHGLLDYSRVSSAGKPFEETDLNELMRKVISDIKVSIDENAAEISTGKLPVIFCDETQIRQLFQNLISNGIKFHKADVAPKIKVTAEKQENKWLFKVSDNGIGMDMKYSSKVFQIFSRLHTSDKYQGSGIGLTVCKKIVERHHGEIWLESEPGKGTTFFFTLAG